MGFEEKHTKQFLMQMSAVACLAVMMTLLMLRGWEAGARRMLFEHDAAVVSFLLDQGISRQTAAEAVLSDGCLCVIGNEDCLRQERPLFDSLETLC